MTTESNNFNVPHRTAVWYVDMSNWFRSRVRKDSCGIVDGALLRAKVDGSGGSLCWQSGVEDWVGADVRCTLGLNHTYSTVTIPLSEDRQTHIPRSCSFTFMIHFPW